MFVFYYFKLNDHIFLFQMTKQMHFLKKKWHYEMVTSKVLFLTVHEMFLSKLLCMLEDSKLQLDKNCINHLLIFLCYGIILFHMKLIVFMIIHILPFKFTDHIFFIQMTKQFPFLKIMLFQNGCG